MGYSPLKMRGCSPYPKNLNIHPKLTPSGPGKCCVTRGDHTHAISRKCAHTGAYRGSGPHSKYSARSAQYKLENVQAECYYCHHENTVRGCAGLRENPEKWHWAARRDIHITGSVPPRQLQHESEQSAVHPALTVRKTRDTQEAW